jgi:hypothetical protein
MPAETTPEQTPEKASETPETAPQVDPEKAELAYRAQAAEAAAFAAREQAAYSAGVAQAVQASRSNHPQIPQVDPLDDYFKNELVLSPEEKRARLATAIGMSNERTRQATRQEMDMKLAAQRNAISEEVAFNTVMAGRPDLSDPRNASNMAAMMTKAKYEADMRGVRLSPAQLMSEAVRMHDQMFRPSQAPRVPYVEGMTRPDMNAPAGAPNAPPQKSDLERIYKMKAGLIQPPPTGEDGGLDWGIETDKYVSGKNNKWLAKGINTEMNEVLMSTAQQGGK